jgi:flagellar FliL protein
MSVPNDVTMNATPDDTGGKFKNLGKNRIRNAIAAALLLASIGGGAWYFISSASGGSDTASSSTTYIEVPAVTVNLRGVDGNARFLKLRFIIVAADAGKVARIEERLPAVLDALQPFLRELRPEDLAGSAAVFRIKEEMMARSADVLGAGVVSDVLIQELLQQ